MRSHPLTSDQEVVITLSMDIALCFAIAIILIFVV